MAKTCLNVASPPSSALKMPEQDAGDDGRHERDADELAGRRRVARVLDAGLHPLVRLVVQLHAERLEDLRLLVEHRLSCPTSVESRKRRYPPATTSVLTSQDAEPSGPGCHVGVCRPRRHEDAHDARQQALARGEGSAGADVDVASVCHKVLGIDAAPPPSVPGNRRYSPFLRRVQRRGRAGRPRTAASWGGAANASRMTSSPDWSRRRAGLVERRQDRREVLLGAARHAVERGASRRR